MQYPSAWENVESQVDNLQLYDVDPASGEVADLVAHVQASGHHKVLKVCCIACIIHLCFHIWSHGCVPV